MRCFKLPLVLFGSWLVPFVALAQYNPGFVATRAVPAGGVPLGIATADLNHDGILDVVIADGSTTTYDSNSVAHTTIYGVAVLLGKGGGAYQPAVHYATSESASFVTIADVDGDGHPDIITASDDPNLVGLPSAPPSGAVEVLKNNGNGTFGAPAKYSFPGWNAVAVYPGDINGDGHLDLVVGLTNTTLDGHATQYLINTGNGTFKIGGQNVGPMPVAVADFDHDGKLDVAALYYHKYTENSFGVMYGNGSTRIFFDVPPIASFFGVTVADFNGDGFLDLAYIADDSSTASVLLNSAGGTFTSKSFLLPGNGLMSGICAGDFNHDGHADLAMINSGAGVFVWFGLGDGTFAYPAQYATSGTAVTLLATLAAADLNNDGVLDLAIPSLDGTLIPIFGKPGGTFNAASSVSFASGVVGLDSATADFNGDGIPDIAMVAVDTTQSLNAFVQILIGDGSGRFKLSPARLPLGTGGGPIAAGDVNRDGKMDLVIQTSSGSGGPEFAVLLGNGDGTFGVPMLMGVTSGSGSGGSSPIYLADVNNDGKLDLVTWFGVHLGNGNGTFAAPIPLPDQSPLFALGDFNRDGKLDLVTLSDARQPVITIYLGSGNGHFPTQSFTDVLPFGDSGNAVLTVGRFTHDGNLGVAAGSDRQFFPDSTVLANGAFVLYAGNGDGTLKAPITYQVPEELWKLAAADFNDDGVDDLAAFNNASFGNQALTGPYFLHQVSLFKSKGDGTLLAPVQFGAGDILFLNNPGRLPIADFNRDGAVDIAGIERTDESILMNSRGTSLVFTATPRTSVHGHAVTLRCAITASFHFSGTMSGTVTFYEGTNSLATVSLATGDVATVDYFGLPVGSHTVTAVFNGNGNFNAHRSNPATFTVTP